METEVDVDNKDLSIAPGMYANTMLRLAHAEGVVTVPVEAVVLEGKQQVVDVLGSNNHVHVRPVQVGLEGSKLAEIKSGLNAGDRVIIGGQDRYQEGTAVDPQVTATPASETEQQTGGMIDLKGQDESGAQSPPPSSAVPARNRETPQPAAKPGGGAR
jgi:hypothetical protein